MPVAESQAPGNRDSEPGPGYRGVAPTLALTRAAQRGFAFIHFLLANWQWIAIGIAALGFLWWADSHIATSAGIKKGEATIKAEWAEANRKQRKAEATKASKASTRLEVNNAKARIITRTITVQVDKIIDRPVYRNVCFDPDGLCLANAAIRGESPTTCKPDESVPRVESVSRWDGSIRLALDYGSVSP
jgi:hypothetical protein